MLAYMQVSNSTTTLLQSRSIGYTHNQIKLNAKKQLGIRISNNKEHYKYLIQTLTAERYDVLQSFNIMLHPKMFRPFYMLPAFSELRKFYGEFISIGYRYLLAHSKMALCYTDTSDLIYHNYMMYRCTYAMYIPGDSE